MPNISRSKYNQTVKFGQLIKCNMRNVFLENQTQNVVGKLVPKRKELLRWNKKAFSTIFHQGFSMKQITQFLLQGECPTLKSVWKSNCPQVHRGTLDSLIKWLSISICRNSLLNRKHNVRWFLLGRFVDLFMLFTHYQ